MRDICDSERITVNDRWWKLNVSDQVTCTSCGVTGAAPMPGRTSEFVRCTGCDDWCCRTCYNTADDVCPICAHDIKVWRETENRNWWRQRVTGTKPILGLVSALMFFVGLRYALGGGPAGDEGPSRVVGIVAMVLAVAMFFSLK